MEPNETGQSKILENIDTIIDYFRELGDVLSKIAEEIAAIFNNVEPEKS